MDESNVIPDPVLSPRIGMVLEPVEGQSFSGSWSRAFSTPTPTNYFLDVSLPFPRCGGRTRRGSPGGGVAPVPWGVLSSGDIQASGAELVATYENYGALTYWGVDLEARAQVSPSATLSVAGSWISEDHFDVTGASCL